MTPPYPIGSRFDFGALQDAHLTAQGPQHDMTQAQDNDVPIRNVENRSLEQVERVANICQKWLIIRQKALVAQRELAGNNGKEKHRNWNERQNEPRNLHQKDLWLGS